MRFPSVRLASVLVAACSGFGDDGDSSDDALTSVALSAKKEDTRSWLVSAPGEVSYRLTFLTPTLFRLHALMDDPVTKKAPELMVVSKEDAYPAVDVTLDDAGGGLKFTVDKTAVSITMPRAGVLSVDMDVDGTKTIESWEISPADHTFSLSLRADEHVYGFGDKRAAVDQRGKIVPMLNKDAMDPTPPLQPGEASETNDSYKSVPFFFTSRGYGLFAHNFFPGEFDVGKASAERLAWKANGGDLDFYVFGGRRPVDVLTEYTGLTGRPALMPRWWFGYHQSRAGYEGLEGKTVAKTMREKKLPLDAIFYDDFVEEAATKAFIAEMMGTWQGRGRGLRALVRRRDVQSLHVGARSEGTRAVRPRRRCRGGGSVASRGALSARSVPLFAERHRPSHRCADPPRVPASRERRPEVGDDRRRVLHRRWPPRGSRDGLQGSEPLPAEGHVARLLRRDATGGGR
jgi:hypothetical protein